MPLLRLAFCALAALLVGCASGGRSAKAPAAYSHYDFPASTVVRTETAYVAPSYAPEVVPAYPAASVSPARVTTYDAPVVSAPVYGSVAENGSYYGQPNANGVPKTVAVNGYYRKDGTYVRGHYRSAPGSNPPSTRRRK